VPFPRIGGVSNQASGELRLPINFSRNASGQASSKERGRPHKARQAVRNVTLVTVQGQLVGSEWAALELSNAAAIAYITRAPHALVFPAGQRFR